MVLQADILGLPQIVQSIKEREAVLSIHKIVLLLAAFRLSYTLNSCYCLAALSGCCERACTK